MVPHSKDIVICPNEKCQGAILIYVLGKGYRKCPSCGYTADYFVEDHLQFHFRLETDAKKRETWTLDQAYWNTQVWEDDWKKLKSPKLLLSWSLRSGCKLHLVKLRKNLKFESTAEHPLAMQFLDQLPGGGRVEVSQQITIYVQEWAAGLRFPEGWESA